MKMSNSMIKSVSIGDLALVKRGSVSKGNQPKFCTSGFWYKEDVNGCESAAETIVSRAVHLTNAVNRIQLVDYNPVWLVRNHGGVKRGCESLSFNDGKCREETLARMMQSKIHIPYESDSFPRPHKLLRLIDKYALCSFDELSCLLQLDRLFINEDRHLYNIVLLNGHIVSFDYGDSLASENVFDYTEGMTALECVKVATAKPFHSNFNVQCTWIKKYSDFELKAIDNVLLVSDLHGFVPEDMLLRMKQILTIQFRDILHTRINFI